MATKPRIDVVLTTEGRNALADDAVRVFMREGKYFNCVSVDQLGSLLNMRVLDPTGQSSHAIELSIPAAFVLYIISAEGGEALGFKP